MNRTLRNRLLLAAVFLMGLLGGYSLDAGYLDPPTIQALIHNGREVEQELEFFGREKIDTGYSFEECLRFRDRSGRRLYLIQSGLESRIFRLSGNYILHLNFIGYTPGGVPLARAGIRTRLKTVGAEPYEGDIREKDPREAEIKRDIAGGGVPPASIRLRYSGTREDYLAFYDLTGRKIYYRYREDRFDDRAKKKIRNLIPGQAYKVAGPFLGVVLAGKFIARGASDYADALAQKQSILVFEYKSAFPLRMEQIIF